MKTINERIFGDLYDSIRNRVEQMNGSFTGYGVEKSIQLLLEKLWLNGKYWDSISFLICYHYTRLDSATLKISEELYYFRKGVTVRELARSLGISITGLDLRTVIDYDEFFKRYTKYDQELPQQHTRKFKIGTWLEGKGISPGGSGSHFCRLWRNRERQKFIKLIILYENSRVGNLDVDLGENKLSIKRHSDPFTIIEEIEKVEH